MIAGNLGLNYGYKASVTEPFEIYSDDFDGVDNLDIVFGYYEKSVLYPLHDRGKSLGQIPEIAKSFVTYDEFANATLEEVYSRVALVRTLDYKVNTFATSYIENKGDGSFEMEPLSNLAQIAPTNSILVKDVTMINTLIWLLQAIYIHQK